MSLPVEVPGRPALRLHHLLLDINGTLTDHGQLLPAVAPRLAALHGMLEVRLLTADTYGTAAQVAASLDVAVQQVRDGGEKAAVAWQLGADRCVAIGNGRNDVALLRAVALASRCSARRGPARTRSPRRTWSARRSMPRWRCWPTPAP